MQGGQLISDWMDKVIEIDVGGKVFKTYRKTLEQSPTIKSLLEWHEKNGEEGKPFLDEDPKIFRHLLNFMRDVQYNVPEEFHYKMVYYGLATTEEQEEESDVWNRYITTMEKRLKEPATWFYPDITQWKIPIKCESSTPEKSVFQLQSGSLRAKVDCVIDIHYSPAMLRCSRIQLSTNFYSWDIDPYRCFPTLIFMLTDWESKVELIFYHPNSEPIDTIVVVGKRWGSNTRRDVRIKLHQSGGFKDECYNLFYNGPGEGREGMRPIRERWETQNVAACITSPFP